MSLSPDLGGRALARAAIAETVARLVAAEARTELRVELVEKRTVLGRSVALVRRGRVWRLGAVCLDAEGALFATGRVQVVARETHPNFRSTVALERNELNRLAQRARIAVGDAVVVDAPPLDLDAAELPGPLVETADGVGVRWAPGAEPLPLAAYLAERVELLVNPPRGAAG